jgi:uncharacterized membrane protein YedE/YeeE
MNELIIWSGWLGGIAIGLYMLTQYWFTGIALGCSGAYCNPLSPISKLSFFHEPEYGKFNNWRLWFSVGLPIGGALGVLTSPDYQWHLTLDMGTMYERVLPENLWARIALLFAGGILMGFGARQAGGCTSGHVISGLSFFNPASFVAAVLFFVGGLLTVQLLFGVLA